MKKVQYLITFFILPLLILILVILNIKINNRNGYKNWQIISYRLGDKNYRLLVADNEKRWERGLMDFRKLDKVDGMIFEFPDKRYRTFWNKNTYLDLNLIWLDGKNVVGKSYLPSIEKSREVVTVNSPVPVDNVLELKK